MREGFSRWWPFRRGYGFDRANSEEIAGGQEDFDQCDVGFVSEAESGGDDQEPGDVCGGGWRGADHAAIGMECVASRGAISIRAADHAVAVVHGGVCEFCGGDGGGARKSASGDTSKSAGRDASEPATAGWIHRSGGQLDIALG